MSRKLIAPLLLLVSARVASAQDVSEEVSADAAIGADVEPEEPDEIGDQHIGASVGIASGGNVTPGGLRIAGHYLYQLSSTDWFDGTASFTYGSNSPACYRDRMNAVECDHGFTDGSAVEIAATVRRFFAPQGQFLPFARAGIGISIVRFGSDDVTGVAFPLHAGAGLRTHVAHDVAIVAQADVQLGLAAFNRGLGSEPQLGMTITAGAEFRLR
jgi:opacity protein-like surface antigen